MPLRLFNTLSAKIEDFLPLDNNHVRMYACGPTVYDYGHIGNFRTFIAVDLLYRFLLQSGYDVRYVMNITDVDDKIIRNSARDGVSVQQYTAKYTQAFFEDSATLSILPPTFVRATEHIPEMADFIAKLVEKGIAYRTDDGSYYFRIAKFPAYGKLSKKDFAGMADGARVDVDEYEKDSARDFALWKAPKPGEASWETSIGPGRPGWHIECSVMSMEELGPSFDLHAGGEDLIFPHHENEIAQSESLTGQQFAKYWFHARFLLVEGQKMSKSLGNFFTVRDLILKGHKPSSIRWLLTQVPYRNQLNFTFDGLHAAASSVEKLRNFRFRLTSTLGLPAATGTSSATSTDGSGAPSARSEQSGSGSGMGSEKSGFGVAQRFSAAVSGNPSDAALAAEGNKATDGKGTTSVVSSASSNDAALAAGGPITKLAYETADRVTAALNDDLNTAEAQGAIFEMLRAANSALDAGEVKQEDARALLATLDRFDAVFAVLKDDDQPKMKSILDWARAAGRADISPALEEIAGSTQLADADINQKIAAMESARKSRNFKVSDALRAELTSAGIIVENTKDGVRWRRK